MHNDHQCTFVFHYLSLHCTVIFLLLFLYSAYIILGKDRRKKPLIPKGPIYELSTCKGLHLFVFLRNVMSEMECIKPKTDFTLESVSRSTKVDDKVLYNMHAFRNKSQREQKTKLL